LTMSAESRCSAPPEHDPVDIQTSAPSHHPCTPPLANTLHLHSFHCWLSSTAAYPHAPRTTTDYRCLYPTPSPSPSPATPDALLLCEVLISSFPKFRARPSVHMGLVAFR